MSEKRFIVGLACNPNVGKSAIFNALTGSRQRVGNWPGKAIERAEGTFRHGAWEIHLVDLSGTYSLAAQSLEEIVTRDYILSDEPDVIVDIVDATCLERNLNLTLQSLELTDKVVVALNLMDEVRRQGWEIDVGALEAALGVPVIPTVAIEGEGLPELVDAVVAVAEGCRRTEPISVDYGMTIEGYVQNLEADLDSLGIDGQSRWLALIILFFGNRALEMTLIYLFISVGAMLLATWFLNRFLFRREPGGFVMELPPFRTPKWGQVIWRTLVHQVGHTMGRAILIAAPATLFIWLLGNLPPGVPFEQTAIGHLFRVLAPLGQLLGLTGEMLVALLFTLPAKEVVISSLAMTYGLQTTLADSQAILDYLAQTWTTLVAFSFLTFCMLCLPCLVTVWATWKETRSLKWMMVSLLLPLLMASTITFLIYQGGALLGFS